MITTALSLTTLIATLVAGWMLGQVATTLVAPRLHLPRNRYTALIPLAAALALAGGVSLGAKQAADDFGISALQATTTGECSDASQCETSTCSSTK